MNDGWIKLHRSFLDWEWYECPNTARLFIHCLLKANHKEGRHKGELVPRGTFLTSLELLSQQTKLSIKSVRTALKHLEETGEIGTERARKGTKITICKYSTYQSSATAGGTEEGTEGADEGQEEGTEGATNKNEKKEKKERDLELFEKAWKEFGRYGTKNKAKVYWLKLTDNQRIEIEEVIPNYLDHIKRTNYNKKFFEGWINPKNKLWENTAYKNTTDGLDKKPMTELTLKDIM